MADTIPAEFFDKLGRPRRFCRGRAFLLVFLVSVEELRQLLDPLDGERGRGDGLHGEAQELHRVVIGGDPVGAEGAADAAPVDQRPLAALSHPDGDGFHSPAALGGPVTGFNVQMLAGEAVGTVVPMLRSGSLRRYETPADLAGKALLAGVMCVVAFFK